MKVSDLKLKAVYIGSGGTERLLVDRSYNRRAAIFQKDADLVEYRAIENRVISNQRCFITARAFARWAIAEKTAKYSVSPGDMYYLGNKRVVVAHVYDLSSLARIRYVGEEQEFVIDVSALSKEPDETSTIDLALFVNKGATE